MIEEKANNPLNPPAAVRVRENPDYDFKINEDFFKVLELESKLGLAKSIIAFLLCILLLMAVYIFIITL